MLPNLISYPSSLCGVNHLLCVSLCPVVFVCFLYSMSVSHYHQFPEHRACISQHKSRVDAMMWRPLLLFFLSLSPCEGCDEECLTGSNRICQREEDLSKLCANQSEVNNNIFRCDSQESSSKNGSRIAKEGDNITLVAQGDHWGQGCSFEIKNTENGVTICYIDENREDQRKGDRPKLCSETKQPDECRQPGSGRYKVRDILEKLGASFF